ncbi:MAG: hypothetical protein FWG88_05160 [Oscillospiraceae bacterium]|nr:hypothetical protein [Oscillospiraceae bacterium]
MEIRVRNGDKSMDFTLHGSPEELARFIVHIYETAAEVLNLKEQPISFNLENNDIEKVASFIKSALSGCDREG